MRKLLKTFMLLIFVSNVQTIEAQFIKKLKKRAEKAAEKAVIRKTEKKVYNETSKKMDTILGNKKGKKSNPEKDPTINSNPSSEKTSIENQEVEIWRNYKFIPGEKVIFYDDLKSEEVGEFPSRWDLAKGGTEVALFNGEKVIIGIAEHHNRITPLFNETNYLSNEFTIEFDIYVDNLSRENYNSWAYYNIIFNSKHIKGSNSPDVKLMIRSNKTEGFAADYGFKVEEINIGKINAWHHIALSYYNGKFKLYFDDQRIINLPKFDIVPDVFVIDMSSHGARKTKIKTAIKNIRIAHGGGQMYKRIMADGKYVTNGILFDSGKSIIKPQSMGIINKVYSVLQEKKDWKFEIIGHTDSDGDDESNLTLSKQRAEAVKQALVNKGIAISRLTTIGKGETKPINKNSSPEEKANNRRVEFILKK